MGFYSLGFNYLNKEKPGEERREGFRPFPEGLHKIQHHIGDGFHMQ